MGASTSCAPEVSFAPECAQQVKGCKETFAADDSYDRKFLNVQLIAAARDGQVDLVREALRGGANPETRQPMRIVAGAGPPGGSATMKAHKSCGPTPLMLAAKSGSVACVQALISARAKVYAKDEDGMKPIHWAALSGELSVIKALMGGRANPLEKDNDNLGILEHAPPEVKRDPYEFRQWRELLDTSSLSAASTTPPMQEADEHMVRVHSASAAARGGEEPTVPQPPSPLADHGIDWEASEQLPLCFEASPATALPPTSAVEAAFLGRRLPKEAAADVPVSGSAAATVP